MLIGSVKLENCAFLEKSFWDALDRGFVVKDTVRGKRIQLFRLGFVFHLLAMV